MRHATTTTATIPGGMTHRPPLLIFLLTRRAWWDYKNDIGAGHVCGLALFSSLGFGGLACLLIG
ncbi:MAG: hypothetical protein K2Y56_21565, partial [Methylobacterium sp.]|uniref:hypothetical protein n=1 Tax=Methylobacterium sp. TaxID=409 RepID=UPI0025DB7E18